MGDPLVTPWIPFWQLFFFTCFPLGNNSMFAWVTHWWPTHFPGYYQTVTNFIIQCFFNLACWPIGDPFISLLISNLQGLHDNLMLHEWLTGNPLISCLDFQLSTIQSPFFSMTQQVIFATWPSGDPLIALLITNCHHIQNSHVFN